MEQIAVREYGSSGRTVFVLHGGPGASGYMAPVARVLSENFRVLEPLQRGSGPISLSVAQHIADLHDLVQERCHGEKPAILGHSWGAMLALAYAAAHPHSAGSLVLVGCGSFDPKSHESLNKVVAERGNEEFRRKAAQLEKAFPDVDQRFCELVRLLNPLYSWDLIRQEPDFVHCDALAYDQTWNDMLRLQSTHIYPNAFTAIKSLVLMLHGDYDPHPGSAIRADLQPFLPQLEYRELKKCGHYPWREQAAREQFFSITASWLHNAWKISPAL